MSSVDQWSITCRSTHCLTMLSKVLAHPGGVQRSRHVQGPRERPTALGEVEAPRVGVQPSTSTRPAATRVERQRTDVVQDQPQEVGPEATGPAPHTRPDRAR